MKFLAAVAFIMVVGSNVQADEGREVAGQKDSKKNLVVVNDKAAEQLRKQQDRKEHMKYLKEITIR
jgi:hypothetical protein